MTRIIRRVLALYCICALASTPAVDSVDARDTYERVIGDYTIRIYRDPGRYQCSTLQIVKNNKKVFVDENYDFQIAEDGRYFVEADDTSTKGATKPGKDINGDDIPDLVVYSWTGGAHGAQGLYIFSLGPELRVTYASKGDVGSWSRFEDLDGDGILEFIAIDKNFEYWNAGYANSPFVEVILAYQGGTYRFATDLMKRPPDGLESFAERVKEAKRDVDEELVDWRRYGGDETGPFVLPMIVPAIMQEYIYAGNAQQAWDYFERIWPKGVPGKERYLADFKKQITQSEYWDEMREAYGYGDLPVRN